MRILFDNGTPAPLRRTLTGHEVVTAYEQGWHTYRNGDLLTVAEAAGFELVITTDKNFRYQQNLASRRIALLILSTTDWRRIRGHSALVVAAVAKIGPGAYLELPFPNEDQTQ